MGVNVGGVFGLGSSVFGSCGQQSSIDELYRQYVSANTITVGGDSYTIATAPTAKKKREQAACLDWLDDRVGGVTKRGRKMLGAA